MVRQLLVLPYLIDENSENEVYFLKAEAAYADITGENANQQYRRGIQASMEQADPEKVDLSE